MINLPLDNPSLTKKTQSTNRRSPNPLLSFMKTDNNSCNAAQQLHQDTVEIKICTYFIKLEE